MNFDVERIDKKWFIFIATILIVLDHALKYLAASTAGGHPFIGTESFGFQYVLNNGHTAIDILISATSLFLLMAIIITCEMFHWLPAMLAAGITSNLVDRIYMGGVVDYIVLFGVSFNAADAMIVASMLLIAARLIVVYVEEERDPYYEDDALYMLHEDW